MCKTALYLHIGSAKCGSTALQNAIFSFDESHKYQAATVDAWGDRNSENLAIAFGGELAEKYWKNKVGLTHDEIVEIRSSFNSNSVREIEQKKSQGSRVFLASSEYIFEQVNNKHKIQNLKNFLLELFDEIHIIFYYRSQTSLAPSLWAQHVKGLSRSFISFKKFMRDENIETHPLLSPYSRLKIWQSNFEQIYFNTIHEENLKGKDLICDFSSYTGVPFFSKNTNCRYNVTQTLLVLEALRFRNFLQKIAPKIVQNRFSLAFFKSLIKFLNFVSRKKLSEFPKHKLPKKILIENKYLNNKFLSEKKQKLPV